MTYREDPESNRIIKEIVQKEKVIQQENLATFMKSIGTAKSYSGDELLDLENLDMS